MKIALTLASLILFGPNSQAQTRTIYYNSQWEIVPKEEASYYRLCQLDSGKFEINKDSRWFVGNVEDFTLDAKLVMKGSYTSGERNGEFTFYYPDGKIQAVGSFKNGFRTGIWKYFFKNGQLKHEVKFPKPQVSGYIAVERGSKPPGFTMLTDFYPVLAYDSTGKLLLEKGTGQWHFEYDWYGMAEHYIVTGKFEKGKKEDLWTCFLSNGLLLYREFYKNDKFVEGIIMNGNKQEKLELPFNNKIMLPYKFEVTEQFIYKIGTSQKHYPFLPFLKEAELKKIFPQEFVQGDTIMNGEKVYTDVDKQAEFPGGIQAMMGFLKLNMTYPKYALRMGMEGKVFVQFTIGTDGSISDIQLFKGVTVELDQEAIRVVSKFPNWIPARHNGETVKSKIVLPIVFSLDDWFRKKK